MDLQTILVVDDNASFRQVVIAMLQGVAREFAECESGEEALVIFERGQPDCVLMDLELKGMDGMETTRRIISRYSGARIVILSQHNDPDLRVEAATAGAIGYLAKEELPALRTLLCEKLTLPS